MVSKFNMLCLHGLVETSEVMSRRKGDLIGKHINIFYFLRFYVKADLCFFFLLACIHLISVCRLALYIQRQVR